jgi:hypothetical protein
VAVPCAASEARRAQKPMPAGPLQTSAKAVSSLAYRANAASNADTCSGKISFSQRRLNHSTINWPCRSAIPTVGSARPADPQLKTQLVQRRLEATSPGSPLGESAHRPTREGLVLASIPGAGGGLALDDRDTHGLATASSVLRSPASSLRISCWPRSAHPLQPQSRDPASWWHVDGSTQRAILACGWHRS